MINTNTIKQRIDQDRELNRLDDTSGDINPYRELIVDTVLLQMEQWIRFSNILSYIQYDRHLKNFYSFNIEAMNKERCKRRSDIEEEKPSTRIRFWRHA